MGLVFIFFGQIRIAFLSWEVAYHGLVNSNLNAKKKCV